MRDRGERHDLIDAVFALPGEDDLLMIVRRVEALGRFLDIDDGANLVAQSAINERAGRPGQPAIRPLPIVEGENVSVKVYFSEYANVGHRKRIVVAQIEEPVVALP